MKHVINYAAYPTQGIEVSRANFAQYVKTHINYLTAAQNPAFGSIISETTTLYDTLFGVISSREQNLNERLSLTQNVQAIKKEFNAKIDELEEVIVYKFHKNSAVYNEIFPHGVTPYKTAALSETIIKMKLAESLAEKYSGMITDTYSIAFKDVRQKFETEVLSQSIANGEVKNVIPDYKAKCLEMDKQLLKNICTIILQNVDNPSTVVAFFDEHLIFPKKNKKVNEQAYVLKVGANTNQAANFSFTSEDLLLITNTGSIPLYYYGASTTDAPKPSTVYEIVPDQKIEITTASIGAPTHKYIIFVNKDLTIEGEVEIAQL